MKRLTPIFTRVLLCSFLLQQTATAQTPTAVPENLIVGKCTLDRTTKQSPSTGMVETVRLEITPASPPVPALKYRMYYRSLEQRSGNRASFYRRSIDNIEKTGTELYKLNNDYDGQALDHKFDAENLRQSAEVITRSVYPRLRTAASCRRCDWGFGIEDLQGNELFEFQLPEISPMRQAVRMLSVKSRHELEAGDFDAAAETIRVGYQMSRDVADGDLFVLKLVGIAMAAVTHAQVENFIATPGSPNLYWAIASLESPFIDMRSAVRYESETCFRALPILRQANESHSAEEWTQRLGDAIVDVASLVEFAGSDPNNSGITINEQSPAWQRKAAATALIATAYPDAKRRLIESGIPEEELDAMPAAQVVVMQQARVVQFLTEELEKSCYLPSTARDAFKVELASAFAMTPVGREYLPVASLLLPALNAANASQARTQRKIAALQVIEALRAHLATSDGKLPDSLDAVTVLPVPLNPVTSKPFEYQLDGDRAILQLPQSDIPAVGYSIRYEIGVKSNP